MDRPDLNRDIVLILTSQSFGFFQWLLGWLSRHSLINEVLESQIIARKQKQTNQTSLTFCRSEVKTSSKNNHGSLPSLEMGKRQRQKEFCILYGAWHTGWHLAALSLSPNRLHYFHLRLFKIPSTWENKSFKIWIETEKHFWQNENNH